MVATVLCELETAAVRSFPSWLPEAACITEPGGAGVHAVRALALRMASVTPHFGPFLADLAEVSLHGADPSNAARTRLSTRFPPETRAAGLARVLAAGYARPRMSLLVHVPQGLSGRAEETLVTGCEWLAHRGEFGIWLTGAPLATVDRIPEMIIRPSTCGAAIHHHRSGLHGTPVDQVGPDPAVPRPAMSYPQVTGTPHPASTAERTLEAALATCDWAAGRMWNQLYQSNPLANPIRIDLLWRDERCAVEIDGEDHRSAGKYATDRMRDVQLQSDGYAVLRFTNDQVMADTEAVVGRLRKFIQTRRIGTLEGT
jgi:Uncharacterized protein conserved in bacteria